MDKETYFKSLSDELGALKHRVRDLIASNHWLTDGEWKESVLRSFLRRNLPRTVEVGRGFVIAEEGVSRQNDVLVFDASKPVLFRDGDLVFVTPDTVEGIIEVKSSINRTSFRDVCVRLAETGELIVSRHPRRHAYDKFFGVFAYELENGEDQSYLDVLREVSDRSAKLLHFFCLGSDMFIRYWQLDPVNPQRICEKWHSYGITGMAPAYFLHNIIEAVCPDSVGENQGLWFPVRGKERYKTGEAAVARPTQ